jgi:LDH2 family malate/lactate/ureidoglycolate dehydrogenase
MEISFADAQRLVVGILTQEGVSAEHAGIVAEHLVDAAATGHAFAGLPRVLALVENIRKRPPAKTIKIDNISDTSILIDGGGNNGYVTSLIGVDEGTSLAKARGFALVGIRNTWFSGRLAYYVERAAREGLIAIHTANTQARVAPFGGIDRIFGTNPIAFAFPSDPDPLVIDFGTGMTTWGETLLRERLGKPMDPGSAVDATGAPTDDPAAALAGAFLPWGEHRGYGLSLVVQVLALLCGSKTIVEDVADCAFFFLLFDPKLLMPVEEFKAQVTRLEKQIEESRPAPGGPNVRVPGRASTRRRHQAEERGTIEVDDKIYETLSKMMSEENAS